MFEENFQQESIAAPHQVIFPHSSAEIQPFLSVPVAKALVPALVVPCLDARKQPESFSAPPALPLCWSSPSSPSSRTLHPPGATHCVHPTDPVVPLLKFLHQLPGRYFPLGSPFCPLPGLSSGLARLLPVAITLRGPAPPTIQRPLAPARAPPFLPCCRHTWTSSPPPASM